MFIACSKRTACNAMYRYFPLVMDQLISRWGEIVPSHSMVNTCFEAAGPFSNGLNKSIDELMSLN